MSDTSRRPLLPALRMGLALAACIALALALSRWQASRALDAARARTEALGLRLEPATLSRRHTAEALAALREADQLCTAIDDSVHHRIRSEHPTGDYDEAIADAIAADEAARAIDALVATAERFLAADVRDLPVAEYLTGLEWNARLRAGALDEGRPETERPRQASTVRNLLVQSLCGAASVAIANGDASAGWRRLALAARVTATARDTNMLGVSFAHLMFSRLSDVHAAAVAAAPDDPARAAVRAALRDYDLFGEARAALRREASFLLHLIGEPHLLGFEPAFRLRLLSDDLRDYAALHSLWADVVDATGLPTVVEIDTALVVFEERVAALRLTRYPLTRLTSPRVRSFWVGAMASQKRLETLLAE